MAIVDEVLGHGSPQAAVDKCTSAHFLMECLQRTPGLDAELLQDVVDACEMNELTALFLGSGQLSEEEAADQLFLTKDEAKAVLVVCRRLCLKEGINFGDGSTYTPERGDDEVPAVAAPAPAAAATSPGANSARRASLDRSAPPASAGTSSKAPAPAPAPVAKAEEPPKQQHQQQPKAEVPASAPKARTDSSSSSKAAAAAAKHAGAGAHTSSHAETHSKAHEHKPVVSPKASPKAKQQPTPLPLPTPPTSPPATAATPPAAESSAAAKKPRPSTAPLGGRAKPAADHGASTSGAQHAASTSQPAAAATPAAGKTPTSAPKPRPQSAHPGPPKSGPTPAYAKPTKSYEHHKAGKDEDAPTASASATELGKSMGTSSRKPASPGVDSKPKTTVFANISSSLLRPTKAFMAWAAGNSKEEREERKMISQSQKLSKAQMQSTTRPVSATKASPFSLSTRVKQTSVTLTTEEMQLLKAKEEAGGSFKARAVPRSLHDGPAISVKTQSTGGAAAGRVRSAGGNGAASTTPASKATRPSTAGANRTPQPAAAAGKAAEGAAAEANGATPNSAAVRSKLPAGPAA